jgi:FKBP-type peptidyl-prolyl cis-trans isomerase FkpA
MEVFMSKAALREQRRAQRIARRNRQRIIIGAIIVLIVALLAFVVIRYSSGNANSYPIGTLDTTPPALSANAITTASGLQYEDLKVGTGATAQKGQTATVNYTLWLSNGTKIQSTTDSKQTFDFAIGAGNVIAGWDEGVLGMNVGGTRLLVIPPALGYGSTAQGTIPADSTLIFEVQLVGLK